MRRAATRVEAARLAAQVESDAGVEAVDVVGEGAARMRIRTRGTARAVGAIWIALAAARVASGQAPTIGTPTLMLPGSNMSLLGPVPGEGGGSFLVAPGRGGILGGRPGANAPRGIPTSISMPPEYEPAPPSTLGITAPRPARIGAQALYGTLALPDGPEFEGPPDGMTLDAAIDRLVVANLDLLAKQYEIPIARADLLNASLRANPIVYADSQLVPYGAYNRARPGGPIQYDVNINYPLDVTRKRQARAASAASAERVVEALYQDSARLAIDSLQHAFVAVLAARLTVAYAEASVVGHDKVLDATRKLYKLDVATRPDVNRIAIQRRNAALGLDDARTRLQKTRGYLATLLNLPPDQANRLELRGAIQDVAPPPPDLATLTKLAIAERPDVVAHRLGVTRADNDVTLARRNAYPDIFLLYQPYTFQNNAPFGLKSSTSWDLGVTATMPVFNRNQGGIERARLNVAQTGTQLADMERLAAVEVETAYREYDVTRRLIAQIKEFTLPAAARLRDDTFQLFTRGELNVLNYLDAEREYNVAVKFYLDTLIRHRLAMLALDTAVGARILP